MVVFLQLECCLEMHLTFVVRVISAAWYLRNCVKRCTKDRNVRSLWWTCLSGIHNRVLTLFA